MTTSSLATAGTDVATADAPVAAEPAADPGTGRFRTVSTIQWVGMVGFLLILLRGACRR